VIELLAKIENNIRKLIGWCPNASAIKYKETMSFDAPQMNTPDIGGGSIHTINGWLNKYHNRILLYSVSLTLLAVVYFRIDGMYYLDMFSSGIIYGLLLSFVTGVDEWRRLNKVAAGKFMSKKRTWKQKAIHFLILISLVVIITFSIGLLAVMTKISMRGVFAFMSGFILPVWIQYFEVLYWERKNRKTLIVEKTSFYAVDVEADGG
jgi:hypothetical protein